jgi:hypothetical protein
MYGVVHVNLCNGPSFEVMGPHTRQTVNRNLKLWFGIVYDVHCEGTSRGLCTVTPKLVYVEK